MMRSRVPLVIAVMAVVLTACSENQPLFSFPPTTVPTPSTTNGTTPDGSTTTTTPPGGSTTPPDSSTSSTTTNPPRPLTMAELTDLTISDLEEFWAITQQEVYGVEYREIADTIPYFPNSGRIPDCGLEDIPPDIAAGNAFYCEPDDYVAWDAEGLFPDLYTEFGDFSVALVLAHEWGHVIQARHRGSVQGPTIMTELQADCFAGAWTADISGGERSVLQLEEGDLEEAMAGYLLFRDPPGTSPMDPAAHGSGFDRVTAFQEGFFGGAGRCAAYEQGEYQVVDIPLTTADLQTGGDLPFDDMVPLLTGALESYWTVTYPVVFVSDWVPVTDFFPYFPSTGELPACGSMPLDEDAYAGNAFYCPDGDFVAWDGETLFQALYQRIGDFAVGMVLSHEWATAVQQRAGLDMQGLDAELQADCLSGAFSAAALPFDNPTNIVLSAGDLDEAISGFLLFADEPGGTAMTGTAFERFDAFEDGFFNGPEACLE